MAEWPILFMKRVVLLFPDHLSIAAFVLTLKLRNTEVNSMEQTVTATLIDTDIEVAKKIVALL